MLPPMSSQLGVVSLDSTDAPVRPVISRTDRGKHWLPIHNIECKRTRPLRSFNYMYLPRKRT